MISSQTCCSLESHMITNTVLKTCWRLELFQQNECVLYVMRRVWSFELEESDGHLYSQEDAGQMLVFGTQGCTAVEGTELVLSWRWQVFLGEGPIMGTLGSGWGPLALHHAG